MTSALRHRVSDEAEAIAFATKSGWGDGLPIVSPTVERVQACLEWAAMEPTQVIGVEPVKERVLTAEKVAANAVLAGCEPPHFPVVAAAVQAMCAEEYLLHGSSSSTGGCAALVVVNGPIRQQLGMTGTFSVLGGGDQAALVIGRAVRLVIRNLVDVRPGDLDRSTFGHPGKISFCLAEDEDDSAWLPLAQERGIPADGTSAVTVMAASGPRQIMNEWTTSPEDILETFASEIRANMLHYSIWGGNYAVLFAPQLRDKFEAAGWSKADVRQFIFERAQVRRRDWEAVGKGAVVGTSKADKIYRALPTPDHLLVVSAGGPAGGFGMVVPPWLGTGSAAVTVPVGACVDC
ncbi:MAG: hypothetical protein OEY23_12700 [Acidimicrobiia bacterium]|nr:hypothetical protein [Acidimicrobiia bacterium]